MIAVIVVVIALIAAVAVIYSVADTHEWRAIVAAATAIEAVVD